MIFAAFRLARSLYGMVQIKCAFPFFTVDMQVTIPKDVREALGVTSGDRISFIVEGNSVRIVNSAIYANQVMQSEKAGETEKAGLTSDDDVMALVKEMRNEDDGE